MATPDSVLVQRAVQNNAFVMLSAQVDAMRALGIDVQPMLLGFLVTAYDLGYKAGLAAAAQQITFIVRDDDGAEEA
jgi:hypothetical protein